MPAAVQFHVAVALRHNRISCGRCLLTLPLSRANGVIGQHLLPMGFERGRDLPSIPYTRVYII